MPKFQIEKSIDINAPAAKVRRIIQDYGQWGVWSPWLCMEPDATLQMEGTAASIGHAYSWQGDMIGSGRMALAEVTGNVDKMDLTFLKPFKSTAKVEFETTTIDDNNTKVSWRMDSGLPFFMFWMVGTMKAMIGMDYDRGLKLLKEYAETGTVTSKTEIVGIVEVPQTHYIGVDASTPLPEIHHSMDTTIPRVIALTEGKTTDDIIGSIYHKMDIKKQHCEYTSFAPVSQADATDSIASCKAIKVVHTGSYPHLGNAWSTANTYQRHKKIKKNKLIPPFELYINDPAKVAGKDLVTEIYLPIQA